VIACLLGQSLERNAPQHGNGQRHAQLASGILRHPHLASEYRSEIAVGGTVLHLQFGLCALVLAQQPNDLRAEGQS
jgi:hypothetical protein